MHDFKVNLNVRVKGNKGWGGFRGEIVEIDENRKIVLIAIPALGNIYILEFNLNELMAC